jgi:hypothetical protein
MYTPPVPTPPATAPPSPGPLPETQTYCTNLWFEGLTLRL